MNPAVGGPRPAPVAPHVRGKVQPRILAHWRAAGWTVHQVGQAAYVHDPDDAHHLILGVWDRGDVEPAWTPRLGVASAGYCRRRDRIWGAESWRRILRKPNGRFAIGLPWWRWPPPVVYRRARP